MNECGFDTFSDLLTEISQLKINKIKTISFVYQHIFNFSGHEQEIKVFVSKNFIDSILNILYSNCVLHQSLIKRKIIGFAHKFCNQKVKENKQTVSVFAHNLFRFDFFLF